METLLVISSYPSRDETHSRKFVGVASYTKNLLVNISGKKTVFAEISKGEKNYKEGDTEVKRVWKRGSFFAFYSILKNILKYKNSKTIIFEFEHAMFGGVLSLIPIPLFIFIAKNLLNKRVIFVFHQVVGDINDLSGHINIEKGSAKAFILNLLISIFYKLILLTSSKAVVFEEKLKLTLGNSSKITVIPHGVEEFNAKLSQIEAKRRLGLEDKNVLLCFGFLAWYKGSDLIINEFKRLPKDMKNNYRLILAGGPNPNHKGKKYYDNYILDLEKKAKEDKIIVTGFVPEEQISLFFQAADLVIFPYRTFMSSSGPLSLCFSFKKPFIVSRAMIGLFETDDFKKTLDKCGLSLSDFSFSFQKNDLKYKIKRALRGNLRKSLIEFTRLIAKERNFKKISNDYEKIFTADEKTITSHTPVLGIERA